MINGKRLKLGPKRQSQSPKDRFGALGAASNAPPACLLHWRGANSTVGDRHLGNAVENRDHPSRAVSPLPTRQDFRHLSSLAQRLDPGSYRLVPPSWVANQVARLASCRAC